MRDSTGAPAALRAVVFNSSNDTIPGAAHFLIIDSTKVITLDTLTGAITALPDTGADSVIASVGSLQSVPITVVVVPPPDTLIPVVSLNDTMGYTLGPGAPKTLKPLTVQLGNRTLASGTVAPVRSYLVHYTFEYPALTNTDTTQVLLVDDSGCPASVLRCASLVDTTDASGNATRSLQVSPATLVAPQESIVVRVDAFQYAAPTVPIAGSPLRFVIRPVLK